MADLFTLAQAQSSSPAADPFGFLLPMAAIFIVFYFLLIRPQQKRQKALKTYWTIIEQ